MQGGSGGMCVKSRIFSEQHMLTICGLMIIRVILVKEGYNWLQGNLDKVLWHYWVWNTTNIPKHPFVSWLTVLGKLRRRAC